MLLWNNRINIGHRLNSRPVKVPRRERRVEARVQDLPAPFPEREPPQCTKAIAPSSGTQASVEAGQPGNETSGEDLMDHQSKTAHSQSVEDLLNQLDWEGIIKRYPGFLWEQELAQIRCPARQVMTYHGLSRQRQRQYANFRITKGVCAKCPHKPNCTSSTSAKFAKQIRVPITTAIAESLRALAADPTQPRRSRSRFARGSPPPKPGPYRCIPCSTFPTETRKAGKKFTKDFRITVTRHGCSPPEKGPTIDQIIRQKRRRRKSWKERFRQNYLWNNVTVTIYCFKKALEPYICVRGRPKGNPPYDLPINTKYRVKAA